MHRPLRTLIPLLLFLLGTGVPAAVAQQVDLSGEWGVTYFEDILHRGATLVPGDNTGVPLSEAGRRKAESWDESVVATHERQCVPHTVQYAVRGPGNIRFAKVVDQETGRLIAYSLQGSYVGHFRNIWMDGRPHPSELARHSYTGFSTGRWERNILVVNTTHMKMGYLDRNGMPSSELGKMTEDFIRHGDRLTAVTFIHDPVFLNAPFIRSTDFVYNPTGNAGNWGVCAPDQIVDELLDKPKGYVPHHLPGVADPNRELFLTSRQVPLEAARGGTATTFPEYAAKMKDLGQGRLGRARHAQHRGAGVRRQPLRPVPAATLGELQVEHVQGKVHMIAGAGANIAAMVGEDGVLMVNSGSAKVSDKVLEAVRKLAPNKPIRFVLNTGAHPDVIGGNQAIAKAGNRSTGRGQGAGASVIAHEGVLTALSTPTGRSAALTASRRSRGRP